jgi:hypothetical protein
MPDLHGAAADTKAQTTTSRGVVLEISASERRRAEQLSRSVLEKHESRRLMGSRRPELDKKQEEP